MIEAFAMFAGYAPPLLAGALALICLIEWRANGLRKHRNRKSQLEQSTKLLAVYVISLERFLANENAPRFLKQALLKHSDALADRKFVFYMTKLISEGVRPDRTEESAGIKAAVDALFVDDREMAETFVGAVVTGTFASILRWPETAAMFEEVSAAMAADPKRDVDVVVTTSAYRHSDLPQTASRDAAMA